jgi:O-antigen/teichoic acid export membrane protein
VTATAEPSVLMRTAKGVGWIVAWRMVTRLLGVASTLTLVRLLLPADFGLVALGTGFAQAVDALSTLGVEDALIREPNPTPAMYHTAYTMDALRSVLTALVIAGAAVPVGAFFKEPRLANVLFALAISSLVQGTNSVGTVDFRRDMAFQKEFQLQVLPRLIMIATTITCALIWRSYWALIAGIMAGRVARWLFGFAMHPYRPVLTLSAWRSLIGFSLWTWAASIASSSAACSAPPRWACIRSAPRSPRCPRPSWSIRSAGCVSRPLPRRGWPGPMCPSCICALWRPPSWSPCRRGSVSRWWPIRWCGWRWGRAGWPRSR